MSGTSKGGRKFAARKRKEDSAYFSKLARKSKSPRGGKHSPGSFKPGNKFAALGGKAGKRGKGKLVTDADIESADVCDIYDLNYDDLK